VRGRLSQISHEAAPGGSKVPLAGEARPLAIIRHLHREKLHGIDQLFTVAKDPHPSQIKEDVFGLDRRLLRLVAKHVAEHDVVRIVIRMAGLVGLADPRIEREAPLRAAPRTGGWCSR
jgi:hypothetical protein